MNRNSHVGLSTPFYTQTIFFFRPKWPELMPYFRPKWLKTLSLWGNTYPSYLKESISPFQDFPLQSSLCFICERWDLVCLHSGLCHLQLQLQVDLNFKKALCFLSVVGYQETETPSFLTSRGQVSVQIS